MATLSQKLAKQAKQNDICDDWHRWILRTGDNKIALIQIYLRGLDFCLAKNYPSLDIIRKDFKGLCENYGIFIDEAFDVTNFKKVVALGSATGTIAETGHSVACIYARHDTTTNLHVSGNAIVMVEVYDDAVLNIHADDNARVTVFQYSRNCRVMTEQKSATAKIKIKFKNKKTY